ncbi:MAG: transcriptional regulator [Rhodospirillales bacterium]|nr:transcriptional regulator [Rhodospirillales bacterium]MBO6787663.1 transcriptional regulator [Rhodospirillales bacterium]
MSEDGENTGPHEDLTAAFAALDIDRDRDRFLRELIGELSETLENVVGLSEAAGFIAVVGARIGAMMDRDYRDALGVERMEVEQVAAALVDLKQRLDSGFSIESIDDSKIVLRNTRCPFGELVKGRTSLCMMTSNVFGKIAAENLGYARLEIPESIAQGDQTCRVIVHLVPKDKRDPEPAREYFAVSDG